MAVIEKHSSELEYARPDGAQRPPRRMHLARILSWVTVAITGGLVILLVFEIGSFEGLAPPGSTPEAAKPPTKEITVSNSTITGFDKEDRPYKVTAASAVQDLKRSNIVHLKSVTAELKKSADEVISLAANTARYDTDAKTLDLEGAVRLVSSDRFVADMAKAQVTLRDKRFRSDVPVSATFETSEVKARGIEITDDGNRILFFNGVKAKFRPANQGSAQP